MPAPKRRRHALRSAAQQPDAEDADAAAEQGTVPEEQGPDSSQGSGEGSRGSGGSGGSDAQRSGSIGGSGGGSAGSGGEGMNGSEKQEDDWAAGPGAARIAPAVEALTMLARNNPKNRCILSDVQAQIPKPLRMVHDPRNAGTQQHIEQVPILILSFILLAAGLSAIRM